MEQESLKHSQLKLLGAEKAATLLMAMGKDSALKLADFFSKKEIKLISEAASRLETINVKTVETLVQEFGKEYVGRGMFSDPENLSAFFESLTTEQSQSDDEKAPPQVADVSSDDDFPDLEHIKQFVENEPVLLGAFFLGTLDDELAANIFKELDPDFRKKLFKAYLDRKSFPDDLRSQFQIQLINLIFEQNTDEGTSENIEGAARIINFFSENDGDDLIGFIADESPEVAAIIKKSLFKFSAIVDLPKSARSVLFDQVETEDLVKALVSANDALKECVLETLSQRNRRMVESELARAQTAQEDIDASQRKIASIVLSLAKEGKISLPGSEDD